MLAIAATVGGASAALARWVQTRPAASGQLHAARIDLTAEPSVEFDVEITGTLAVPTTAYRAITLVNTGTTALQYRLSGVTHTGTLVGTTVTGRFFDVADDGQCNAAGVPASHIATAPGDSSALIGQSFVEWITVAKGQSDVICLALTVPAVTSPLFVPGTDPVTLSFGARSIVP